MAIIATCRPDENGVYPDGAWVNIERGYEGHHRASYKKGMISEWNATTGKFEEVLEPYGPYRSGRRLGFQPQVSADHVLHITHEGLVLSLGEDNGYNDSDFWAIVWNPQTKSTERVTYASTRGWTYDLSASVDATDEVRAAYAAHEAYKRRHWTVMSRRGASKMRAELARTFNVPMSHIRRLEAAYGPLNPVPLAFKDSYYSRENRALAISLGFVREPTQLDRLLKLAESGLKGKLRNDFKKKMATQVVDWLRDPAPQYDRPLSKKQAQYV
jgi:hypothetical protein